MRFSQDELCSAGDWSPPTCSVKSEGNSQFLRFRTMSVMPSGLFSLISNGGWNSFASVSVSKPCAALGSLLNRCFRVSGQSVSAETRSVGVIRKKATSAGWDSAPNDLREHIVGSRKVRWFWKRQQSVPSDTVSVGVTLEKPTSTWDSLLTDLQANVLQTDFFRFKTSSNSWKKFINGEASRQSRGGISEGVFTAITYYIKNNVWRCSGYDLHSKSWRSLPSVSYLPPLDAELFKEYSVRGYGGLMRAEVSKLPNKGELVVFNPVTAETRALPPLLHPRNPVLFHISVDSAKKSYKVIVAGSSAASDEHFSRKVEVFDSSTSKWKEVCELPGPTFGLNEHQAGVFLNGKLFLISYLEGGGRGVVAFDVESGTWLQDLTVPIPRSSYSNTLELGESDGKLFVFSEQESDQSVDHCIDELEFLNPKAGVWTCRWRSFVKVKKSGGRGLRVYPEHTCVGFREEKLGTYSPLSKKLLNILLASCIAIMPNGACAADSLSGMRNPSNAWESPDYAKKAAVTTLLVGLTMIGVRAAWGIFRRHQARGHRFDINRGLEVRDRPGRREQLREILPAIPA